MKLNNLGICRLVALMDALEIVNEKEADLGRPMTAKEESKLGGKSLERFVALRGDKYSAKYFPNDKAFQTDEEIATGILQLDTPEPDAPSAEEEDRRDSLGDETPAYADSVLRQLAGVI